MRAARRAATYAGRTTCSTKYMRKRTSPPVSATDASAQSDASIARIRARTYAANATQTGMTIPTRTWPDPGLLPGGFGIEPPAQTPRIGATTRQIGASQTRGRNLCVASASTLATHRHLRPVLKATARPGLPVAEVSVAQRTCHGGGAGAGAYAAHSTRREDRGGGGRRLPLLPLRYFIRGPRTDRSFDRSRCSGCLPSRRPAVPGCYRSSSGRR